MALGFPAPIKSVEGGCGSRVGDDLRRGNGCGGRGGGGGSRFGGRGGRQSGALPPTRQPHDGTGWGNLMGRKNRVHIHHKSSKKYCLRKNIMSCILKKHIQKAVQQMREDHCGQLLPLMGGLVTWVPTALRVAQRGCEEPNPEPGPREENVGSPPTASTTHGNRRRRSAVSEEEETVGGGTPPIFFFDVPLCRGRRLFR